MTQDLKRKLEDFFEGQGVRAYKKGETIIRADDEPTGVFLIKSGYVKMSTTFRNGTETAVNIYKPGTFFPMTWAIAEIPNVYNYQALSVVKLYKAPKDEFIAFIKSSPDVLFDLMKRVFIGLEGTLFNLKNLLHGNSYQRVAVILYMMAKRFGLKKKDGEVKIAIPVTHFDISHYAGLTRETTTIMVNKLIKAGILKHEKRSIVVRDMAALKKVFTD